MTDQMMRQVTMRRLKGDGMVVDVCWIRNALARVGARVRSEEDGEIWTVVEIYGAQPISRLQSAEATRSDFEEVLS